MRKEPVGWTLSPETVKNVKKAAEADSRSVSQFVDVLLSKHFKANPVQK